MKTAVLLMAYGAAATVEEIPAYLQDIRGGRPASPELIADIRGRYRLMGGRSPLLDITRRQAAALQERLQKPLTSPSPQKGEGASSLSPLGGEGGGEGIEVFIGMRHSAPTIREAVEEMHARKCERVVAFPLTPYYSKMSVEAYHAKYRAALQETGARFETIFVDSWNDHPLLIEVWAAKVQEALNSIPTEHGGRVSVVFSAHSLPQRIVEENDPYPEELKETITAVAEKVGLSSWEFAYQSRGRTAEPWLGPDVSEVIDRLAEAGCRNLVLVPIGFISDHMETLYDDDVLYRDRARSKGMRFARARSLNDDPLLLDAVADVVRRLLEPKNLLPH